MTEGAQGYAEKGILYLGQKKYNSAIEEFRKALEIDPKNELARLKLVYIYHHHEKRGDLAREEAERLLEINPDNIEACQELGDIYLEKEDPAQAMAQFKKVLKLGLEKVGNHPELLIVYIGQTYVNIGRACLLMEKYDLAVENFEWAIRLRPGEEGIRRLLSLAYIRAKRYDHAVATVSGKYRHAEPVEPKATHVKIKILRIPNFYGTGVYSTEMNSIMLPPLALGNIVAFVRSRGISIDQDDLHIKSHYDNYFGNPGQYIDETIFFDIPRVVAYAKGKDDSQIDMFMDRAISKTSLNGCKIVLFSLDNCSMNDSHAMFAVCLARYLKRKHKPIIILGGVNYFVELMKKNDCDWKDIDYVIKNEGEEIVADLLFSLIENRPYEGTGKKTEREIESIEVPGPVRPDFDGLPLDKYKYYGLKTGHVRCDYLRDEINKFNKSEVLLLPFRFIKGCTNRCIFCASSFGGLIHVTPASIVADWLQELQARYNPTGYIFLNDTLNISKKYIDQLCDEIIKRKLKILWSDCARVDRLDKETICKLKEAGCIRLVFGMETASERLLKYINKDINLKQLEEAIYWTAQAGIWTGIELISGLPHETEEDVDATISFLKRNLGHIDAFYYNAFNIKDTSLMRLSPERYGISNIFELSNYEDGFSTFVRYGFNEIDGLKWPEKRKQILGAFDKTIRNFGIPAFPEHEYEHFLFFLYSNYGDKKTIKDLFYSVGKEKNRYLDSLRQEKIKNWRPQQGPVDRTLVYG